MPIRRTLVLLALSLLALLQAGSASATHLAPMVTVGREGGFIWDMLDPQVASSTLSEPDQNGVQTWDLTSPFTVTSYSVTDFTVQMKEDPFVTNNITLQNLTSSTQTFIVSVILPIPAFAYDATIASSIGVTVTDSNSNGSVSASSVSPGGIYSGTVNGGTILTLMPHLTTVSCATAGCSNTLSDNTGVPLLAAIPGVANQIGITLKFTLSAFDSNGITSRFEIVSVPEPAALALLAAGLFALAAAKRRVS